MVSRTFVVGHCTKGKKESQEGVPKRSGNGILSGKKLLEKRSPP